MAVTAETRTSLIGLSVAMLGSAPGTDQLNMWVGALDDGSSLEDIANHIASSDAFQNAYPAFLTNEEFATAFLNSSLGAEVSAELIGAAAALVVGLLNDGTSRGELALLVVGVLFDIAAQGDAHAAAADLGAAASAFANKVDVAEYYTLDQRISGPSSSAIADVSSDADSVTAAKTAIDNLDSAGLTGEVFLLTSSRDSLVGTAGNDGFFAEPSADGHTLQAYDSIDGGEGDDTLTVYGGRANVIVNTERVSNLENLVIDTLGGLDVDTSDWTGLASIELARFSGDVTVVADGASVSVGKTAGGVTSIVGAGGALELTAGGSAAVTIGSAGETTSVSVTGGAIVDVSKTGGAGVSGGQSETVTSVSLDGLKLHDLGSDDVRGTTGMERVPNPDAATNEDMPFLDAEGRPTDDEADDAAMQVDATSADGRPSAHVLSKAIESISLSNTDATVAVINGSEDPEDLSVTVNKYGSHNDDALEGKLCLTGSGAAENVSINVAGDSDFYLAGDATKTVSISGDAKLTLEVTKFGPADLSVPPDEVDVSDTLETVTITDGASVTFDATDMGKLTSIDASAGTGNNTLKGIGAGVESVSGGSGSDNVTIDALNTAGRTVDLGAGNDTYTASNGNAKSSIDGGEGMDVLALSGGGSVVNAQKQSIYQNFETLDVGGGSGAYDVALLGVESVRVGKSNVDADGSGEINDTEIITLNKMADGMGIGVHGSSTGGTTDAVIIHTMPDREPGTARYSGELDVSLTANGGKDDTKAMGGQTGLANLTLTADAEIEVLNVDSSASPGGKGATAPSAANYGNTLTLANDAATANVEAISVTGNARLTIAGEDAAYGNLELIDAEDNSGGVTFDGGGLTEEELDLLGGSGADDFTGGSQDDTLMGNAGNDKLTGGGGDDTLRGGAGMDTLDGGANGSGDDAGDRYVIAEASESTLVFTDSGMGGFDTIAANGLGADDVILVSKSLRDSFQGSIKTSEDINADDETVVATFAVNDGDGEELGTAATLKALIGDGDGFFETPGAGVGFGTGTINKHSVAVVREELVAIQAVDDIEETEEDETVEARDAVNNTWIFIDVDGDGDFDAGSDIAIRLIGDQTGSIDADSFGAI